MCQDSSQVGGRLVMNTIQAVVARKSVAMVTFVAMITFVAMVTTNPSCGCLTKERKLQAVSCVDIATQSATESITS